MANQHGSFIWYELITPDPTGAKTFYDAVVGWDIEPQPSSFGRDYRMIRRSGGGNAGGLLRLSDEMRNEGLSPVWLGYVGVADVDRTAASVQQGGGQVVMPPWDIPGVGRLTMIVDPQGAPLYLMRGASEQDSDAFSVDQPQHVRWNELATSDPDAAVDFYVRQFGWAQEGSMDMGEMGQYRFIQHGGVMIGAIMPKMPQVPASMWSFYIGVDDIERAHDAIGSGGGRVLQGPMEIPGGDFAINAVDPQGAAFGLVGPRKS